MTDAAVTMQPRAITPETSVISIGGAVNRAAESALMDAYERAATQSTRVIILDFTGLEYMNSSGIGLLVTLLVHANRRGQEIWAYGLNAHYQDIFALTRLNEAIRIFPGEASALAAAK